MKFIEAMASEVGGEARRQAMLEAQGVSLILKRIDVRFKVCSYLHPSQHHVGLPPNRLSETSGLSRYGSYFVLDSVTFIRLSHPLLVASNRTKAALNSTNSVHR
jgi:hypothetical protein